MEAGFPNRMDAPLNWQHRDGKVFWGEISPGEHLLQIYENECVLLDTLERFVSGGLELGEGVILIVTPEHLKAVEKRLLVRGFDVEVARANDQYIPLDAATTLAQFLQRGWPDAVLFESLMLKLLNRASGRRLRRVRAFGEMVAFLWAQRNYGATIQLEHLWHDLCKIERFSLLCAYPLKGFSRDAPEAIHQIHASHPNIVARRATI